MNRELRLALVLVLAGAGLAYLAAGRDWVDAVLPALPPLPASQRTLTGAQVTPALRPLAFLGLAAVAALAATRARGRILVGALVAVAGVALVATTSAALARGSARALVDNPQPGAAGTGAAPGFTAWWLPALLGGLLLLAGGLLVAVRGRRWVALSSQYDPPAARADRPPPRPEVAAWDALDRGEDPTTPAPSPAPRIEG